MIDPRGLSLQQWSDGLLLAVDDTWGFGRLDDIAQWQSWAVNFLRALPTSDRVMPDPYQFDDWMDWAMRVYPMLEEAAV